MTLYALKFNNYYNRIIKRYETIEEYEENATVLGIFENINFIPNDGVSTTQTLNYTWDVDIDGHPDYILAVESGTTQNGLTYYTISRWFVVEEKRNLSGQYDHILYRDTIADFYDEIIDAPVFVEKATLSSSNPLIFNKEDMSYNQIKTNEILLKDRSQIPWLVGYCDRDWYGTDGKIEIPAGDLTDSEHYSVTSLEDYTYYNYKNYNFLTPELSNLSLSLYAYFDDPGPLGQEYFKQNVYVWDINGNPTNSTNLDSDMSSTGDYVFTSNTRTPNNLRIGYKLINKDKSIPNSVLSSGIKSIDWKTLSYLAYFNYPSDNPNISIDIPIHSSLEKNNFLLENGKIILETSTGKYYKIKIKKNSDINLNSIISSASSLGIKFSSLANELIDKGYLSNPYALPTYDKKPFQINCLASSYSLEFEELSDSKLTINLTARPHSNSEYDIFCIPYGDIGINGDLKRSNPYWSYKLASEIIRIGAGNIYDVQLLPFCPLPQNRIDISGIIGPRIYLNKGDSILEKENYEGLPGLNCLTAMFWVGSSDFSFSIEAPDIDELKAAEDAISLKIQNETSIHRLTSPNYNGIFEFSVAKNNGVQYFDVDCSYKPYQPYIKIAPNFKNLYGKDFNDTRGLILGGDFSLTQVKDEWATYQIQNKNYQEIFNRQITNLELNNSVQKQKEIFNAATGVISGVISGAVGGSIKGGVAGAFAGGIMSGATSAFGAAVDYQLNERLRNESIDYTKDQFGYQLGNIQALPDSITKVSSFNPNNKIFPVLEYYTCTGTEVEALRNKIKYNGMTVMTIGKIKDFLQNEPSYIKSRLIRLETIPEDFHMVNTISQELNKGVFI